MPDRYSHYQNEDFPADPNVGYLGRNPQPAREDRQPAREGSQVARNPQPVRNGRQQAREGRPTKMVSGNDGQSRAGFREDVFYRNTNQGTRNTLRPANRNAAGGGAVVNGGQGAYPAGDQQLSDFSRSSSTYQRGGRARTRAAEAEAQFAQRLQGGQGNQAHQASYEQPRQLRQASYGQAPRGQGPSAVPYGQDPQQAPYQPGGAAYGDVPHYSVHANRSERARSKNGYQGYGATRRAQAQRNGSNLSGEAAYYGDVSRYSAKRTKKPLNKVAVIVAVAVIAVLAVGIWIFMNPRSFPVTVNGIEYTVDRGTTVGDLIDEGYAAPMAGNLLAIDGNVLQTGGGAEYSGMINGEENNDRTTEVHKEDVITINNGGDITEDVTVEQVEIAPTTVSGGSGSLHVFLEGEPGIVNRKTGVVSGITQDETVKEVVNAGYVKFNADPEQKVIALTFDDGPWPSSTSQILDILDQYGAKATFFTIGNQVSDNADVVKRAKEAGHQVATHTWDHASGSGQTVNLGYMTAEEQIQEVEKGFGVLDDLFGEKVSRVFRAPGGNFSGDTVTNLEPYVTAEIGWNIDTDDWQRPGVDAIVSQIESASSGNVILMHDGGGDRSQTVEALSIALPYLVNQGYQFVTIDELLAMQDYSKIKVEE